ncbi:MAG: gliding motility-associated C-terminal domain-containing protein [Flavobacteriaceae bacterium]|nr:gliding motility-associated C-terminal domain-containing protein [Flavobacteriaceae bacterium]
MFVRNIEIMLNKYFILVLAIFCVGSLFAQSTINLGPSDEVINNFFEAEGISILNSSLISGNRDEQIALLSNGIEGANLAIDQGIAFSTGNIESDLLSINQSAETSNTHQAFVDADLQSIDSLAVFDPVIYQFEIQITNPTVTQIKIRYQFGSEEYPNWVGSRFNDVFAVFVSGPGFEETINVASIPTSGNPTAVNFVNGGVEGANSDGSPTDLTQTDLYINNGHVTDGSANNNPQPGPFPIHIEYNGITEVIESTITGLQFGEVYTIKLAIADVADQAFDSGVIFEPFITNIEQSEISLLKEGEIFEMQNQDYLTPGDLIKYSFTIINIGEQTLTSLMLNDFSFPDQIEIPELETTTLFPGDTISVEAFYAISQDDINAGVVYNQAEVFAIDQASQDLIAFSKDPTPLPEDHPFYLASCPFCTVVILPQNPQINLVKRALIDINTPIPPVINQEIIYSFDLKNTGNVDLYDLELIDHLPGIEIMGSVDFLQVGEIATESFTASYRVQQIDIEQGQVLNQAEVFAYSPLDQEVSDLSDFDNFFQDRPTIVEFSECQLEIFNAITPNDDGINDVFKIQGIECFPDNRVQIFNRYGVKIYDDKNYDNQQVVFDGKSSGRATLSSSSGVPSGVYFYILEYTDREGVKHKKQGDLYINQGN